MRSLKVMFASIGGGSGGYAQDMPLIPGQQGSTVGAADIDTSDMKIIYIVGACDVYVNSDSGNTIPIVTSGRFAVHKCDSIHVSAAVKYAWI